MNNKLFWNIIQKYRWQSAYFKNFFFIAAFVALPLSLIAVFSSYKYYAETNKTVEQYYKNETEKISYSVDAVINSISANYTKIASNEKILSFLYRDYKNTGIKYSFDVSEVINALLQAKTDILLLDSVQLYIVNNRYVLSTNGSNYLEKYTDTGWLDIYHEKGGIDYIVRREFNGESYVTVCRNIRSSANVADGIIVYNFLASDFSERLTGSDSAISSLTLSDVRGDIIYSMEKSLDEKQLAFSYVSDDTGITVTVSYAKKGFVEFGNPAFNFIIYMFVFVIFAALFVSFRLSNNFYKSIFGIMNALEGTYYINKKSGTEYEYIIKNIISLKSNYSEIEQQLADKLSALRSTQILALQEQINPHFIFNALTLVNMYDMAEHKAKTDTSKIVLLLSDILRQVLESKEYIVSLEKELEYLEKYIELQNIRFCGRIAFEEFIEDETATLSCVKFMLQPIVENAITHGIMKKTSCSGIIKISSAVSDNKLVITISDDGIGISEQKLNELRDNLQKNETPQNENIGLLNVHQRIKLVFGDEYGVSVNSDMSGTMVSCTLPVRKYTEE